MSHFIFRRSSAFFPEGLDIRLSPVVEHPLWHCCPLTFYSQPVNSHEVTSDFHVHLHFSVNQWQWMNISIIHAGHFFYWEFCSPLSIHWICYIVLILNLSSSFILLHLVPVRWMVCKSSLSFHAIPSLHCGLWCVEALQFRFQVIPFVLCCFSLYMCCFGVI